MLSLIEIKKKLSETKKGKIVIKIYHYLIAVPFLWYNSLKFKFIRKKIKLIKFYSLEETFKKLINEKKSLCRFGDGEVSWIYKGSKGYFGQENSEELSKKLYEVIHSKNEKVLIGVPNFFGDVPHFNNRRRIQRNAHLSKYYKRWMSLLDENYIYTDALITRVYMGVINENYKRIFDNWKKVWKGRDVLVVEGEQTKFAVGNDLLKNAKSVRRIIAPAENAFKKYEEILKEVKLEVKEDTLILICLGPTATVLSYEIGILGFQAIDIGHLDIEYEWFLLKANKKISIPGKYVNEAGGAPLIEISEHLLKEYNKQVVKRIKHNKGENNEF